MEEIKVIPYIPDEDYDNPAMVVDFYEFTMANCLFLVFLCFVPGSDHLNVFVEAVLRQKRVIQNAKNVGTLVGILFEH